MKVSVVTEDDDGEKVTEEISPEHFCMLEVEKAVINGKSAVNALVFLANVGAMALEKETKPEDFANLKQDALGY